MIEAAALLRPPAARGLRRLPARPRRRSRSPTRPRRDRRPGRRATPVLLLQVLLGLEPDHGRQTLELGRAGRSCLRGPARSDSRACAPSTGSGTSSLDGRPRRGRGGGGARARREVAILQPRLVPGSADRLRRDRVGRVAARRRPRRRRPRRDALRLGRLAHARRSSSPSSPRRRRAGSATSSVELRHALACYEHADEFDVDQRPLRRRSRRRCGGLVATPVVHTVHGPLDERQLAQSTAASRSSRRSVGLDLDLDEPAQPGPDLPWVANCPNALDLDAYPYHAGARRVPPLPRPPVRRTRARTGRSRSRARPGLPIKLAGKKRDTLEQEYFDELVAPLLGDDIEYLGEIEPRVEGRAAPERARDALPDRLGGAVRPGHDRVDGLRDAGDRDPPRRRARGRRPTAAAGSSWTTTARWWPRSRRPTSSIPPSAAALRRGALLARADGRRLRRRVRGAAQGLARAAPGPRVDPEPRCDGGAIPCRARERGRRESPSPRRARRSPRRGRSSGGARSSRTAARFLPPARSCGRRPAWSGLPWPWPTR